MDYENKHNICRAFVLYNDFLPPATAVHEGWQYMSFGYYDGLSVGNNLFESNNWSLENLWKYNAMQGEELDGSYSYRILWGLRCETESLYSDDEQFWDSSQSQEYPFLFVSLIQIKKTVNLSLSHRKKVEDRLTKKGQIKAITYLTLDNSDLILVLQCKRYEDGTAIINKMHYENGDTQRMTEAWNLNYSFTIASVNKTILKEDALINTIEGNVSHAYIYAIQKRVGGISNIKTAIEAHINQNTKNDIGRKYIDHSAAVLGCNDEVIVLKDIPWSTFLKLFQEEKGILNHTNSLYKDMLNGVTTIVGKAQDDTGKEMDMLEISQRKQSEFTFSESLWEKCKKVFQLDSNVQLANIKRGLYQILNTLRKFEMSSFSDYLVQTVRRPLNMVIDMANPSEWISDEYFYASFYEFMKGVNLYAQNEAHTDRQFTQTPDMNIRIYDSPVKLNAFYNAFIYYLKTYLNSFEQMEDRHEYEFLACPGVTGNMRVQELFKKISTEKRLFLVEMPEYQIYNSKEMMIMLAHEVSHFVGTNVRNRSFRFECMEEMIAKSIVRYMRAQIKYYVKRNDGNDWRREWLFLDTTDYWEQTEKNILQEIENFAKNYTEYLENTKFPCMNTEERDLLKRMLEDRKEHSELLSKCMIDASAGILEKKERWNYLFEKEYIYWIQKDSTLAEDKRTKLKEFILNVSGNFLSYDLWNENALSAKSVVDVMLYYLKECFADLMAIMTLQLPMLDYLHVILQNDEGNDSSDQYIIRGVDIRSALVTSCMCYNDPSLGYRWDDRELERISQCEDQKLRQYKDKILDFRLDYLDLNSYKEYENASANRAMDIMLDSGILEIMMKYLLRCKFEFVKGNQKNVDKQKQLRLIYELFSIDNVENLVLQMQSYVDCYLKMG